MLGRQQLVGTFLLGESARLLSQLLCQTVCLNLVYMSADNLHLCLSDETLLALVHFAVVPLAIVEIEVLRLAELRGGR